MVSYSSIKSQGPFMGVHCPKIAISFLFISQTFLNLQIYKMLEVKTVISRVGRNVKKMVYVFSSSWDLDSQINDC